MHAPPSGLVFPLPIAHSVFRVTTCLENLEMSGNLKHVREMSGIMLTVRELSGKIIVRENWPDWGV